MASDFRLSGLLSGDDALRIYRGDLLVGGGIGNLCGGLCGSLDGHFLADLYGQLFLCNRQQTEFYLFITCGDKPFRSKDFSNALAVSRVSFAPAELMETMLGTQIGAATVFSSLLDCDNKVQIVFDKDVLSEEYYGCSDGTTTGYMKIRTEDIVRRFLTYAKHKLTVIEV